MSQDEEYISPDTVMFSKRYTEYMETHNNIWTKEFSEGELLEELKLQNVFKKDQEFSIIAGAGVSLDAPSSMPTGFQFTRELLNYISPPGYADKLMELMNPQGENKRHPGDFLRFEQLIELIHEEHDPEFSILDIYNCSTPNFNHLVLAKLIKGGHNVITTNIDSLIEHGLIELGVPVSQITPIMSHLQKNHLLQMRCIKFTDH